ncbi:putative transporter [Aspergillus steynii IBT 23096]|uniref:Putative transporter n=1 Tax=Aspergillus steynii IBT 23096 TaxID=1392250 RepID=A0A2I2GB82_9EURO|nr:putative transporter [Aspergillus steynii IBT 23096]PLB50107.1 putative transporter [Aspergillus steynii IBT 23096]
MKLSTFRMFSIPRYLTSAIIVSIGGLLNGLDTGVIGPLTVMPSFLETIGHISASIHGLIISSVLLSATFASLFSGILSDRLGRTRLLAIGSFVFTIGVTMEASASHLAVFLLGRLVAGIGEGLFLSTLVVYICEISPAKYRGPLASMVQLFITIGLMVGYFMCYGTVLVLSAFSWRFPLAIQVGLAALLTVLATFYLPESPRWLTHRGRHVEAEAAWVALQVGDVDRGGDFSDGLHSHPDEGTSSDENLSRWERARGQYHLAVRKLKQIMGPGSRRQALLGIFVMSMQQLSGIDGILYYAPLLFQQAGLSSSKASFFASGVSAILICVSSIPAFLLTDRIGRRASTLYGGMVLATVMATIGSLYASGSVHTSSGVGRWVVIVAIYVFSITYCMTWALGIKVFASEIQPVPTRATVTSIAQSANCITNFAVAYITPVLLDKSPFGIYFLFCGCILSTVGVCAVYMPETKGKAMESISGEFQHHQRHLVGLGSGIRLRNWRGAR